MKIILIRDVPKLGKRFDIKEVNSGHAINFLIPQKMAVAATPEAIKHLESEKSIVEGEKKMQADLLAKNIDDIEGIILEVSGKANEKGHLFAGLHREEIVAELLKQTRLSVDPSFIQLEHPIKEIGEHVIEVRSGNKSAKFKLKINPL